MGCAAAGARWGGEILVGDVQAALEWARKQPAFYSIGTFGRVMSCLFSAVVAFRDVENGNA